MDVLGWLFRWMQSGQAVDPTPAPPATSDRDHLVPDYLADAVAPFLIQNLDVVVRGAVGGLPDFDDGGPGWEDDPSSAGPPGSWGTGIIDRDWDGNPIRPKDLETRNPGPRRRKKKGNGRQPNKNKVNPNNPTNTSYLYQCSASVLVTEPGPFFGLNPSFQGCVCVGANYLALAGAPTSARQFPNWRTAREIFFADNEISDGAYSFNTGTDTVTGPIRICTTTDLTTAGPQSNGCTLITGDPSSL